MEESSALTEDYRQLSNGQLAIAGVSIAVISMILEFIALSGFSPRYVLYLVFYCFAGLRHVVLSQGVLYSLPYDAL